MRSVILVCCMFGLACAARAQAPDLAALEAAYAQAQAEHASALERLKDAQAAWRTRSSDPRAAEELALAKTAVEEKAARMKAARRALDAAKAAPPKPAPVPEPPAPPAPTPRRPPKLEPEAEHPAPVPGGGTPPPPIRRPDVPEKPDLPEKPAKPKAGEPEGPPGKAWGHLDKDDPRHPGARGRMRNLTPKGETLRGQAIQEHAEKVKALKAKHAKELAETANPLRRREVEARFESERKALDTVHEKRLAEIEKDHGLPEGAPPPEEKKPEKEEPGKGRPGKGRTGQGGDEAGPRGPGRTKPEDEGTPRRPKPAPRR